MDLRALSRVKRKPIEVFCCSAREDQSLLLELKTHLMPFQREGFITLKAEIDIDAGIEWEKEIHRHLDTDRIILLLISPNFIASDYCHDVEMPRAMERHEQGEADVIPIILRPVFWQNTPFSKLDVLPRDGTPIVSGKWHNRDEAFYDVAQGIRAALEKIISDKQEEGLLPLPTQTTDPFLQRKAPSFFQRLLQFYTYRKTYYEDLLAFSRHIDLTGLNTQPPIVLSMEQIFVEPSLALTPAHEASANPFLTENRRSYEHHPIWYYLASKHLEGQHFVIVGAPGSGKTTLLRHIILRLVASKMPEDSFTRSHLIPIFLSLQDHVDEINSRENFSLVDAVSIHLGRKRKLFLLKWLEQQLVQGRCLILLDGLDEVADIERRHQVSKWIQRQMDSYQRNHFILTSRPFGYQHNQLERVNVLEIQPLNFQQITQYIQGWCIANETQHMQRDTGETRERARQKAADLLERLHNTSSLLELAVNPLSLTMLVAVHQYRGSLPTQRYELYAETCQVFLEKRSEARGLTLVFKPGQVQQMLQHLAYTMMCWERQDIPLQDICQAIMQPLRQIHPDPRMSVEVFLRLVEDASGLFLEQDNGCYRFAHRTLQEYLAAAYIREKGMEHVPVNQVTNSWWHETIRLYCSQADATAVIQACLSVDPPRVEALVLALECDEAKLELQVQAQLHAFLKTKIENVDPRWRSVIAEALLMRRLHRMIHLQQETFIDTSLITCAEYQLFLDEKRVEGHFHQPDHWTTCSFPEGLGNTPVLGVRRSDAQAFCEWLTTRDRKGWHYRLPRTGEWPVKERERWKELCVEVGYWTGDQTHFEWIQGTSPEGFQKQLTRVRDNTLAPDHALDYAFDCAFDRASAIDLDYAFDRANTLNNARIHTDSEVKALSYSFLRELAYNDAIHHANYLARLCTNANAIADYLDFDRNHASAHARASACARVCDLAITFASDLASTLRRVIDNHPPYFSSPREPSSGLELADHRHRVDELRNDIASVLNLYVLGLLLQKRIAGDFPAYEGILLVKVHRQGGDGSEV